MTIKSSTEKRKKRPLRNREIENPKTVSRKSSDSKLFGLGFSSDLQERCDISTQTILDKSEATMITPQDRNKIFEGKIRYIRLFRYRKRQNSYLDLDILLYIVTFG